MPAVRSVRMLTLDAADAMCNAALEEAKRLKTNPVAVAVVDAAGHQVVVKRMDGGAACLSTIALAKAKSCTNLGMSTRVLRDKYADRTNQVLAMVDISGGEIAPFPGGVLCRDTEGDGGGILGAIGVAGASGEQDEHCAIIGTEAVGFVPEPAESSL